MKNVSAAVAGLGILALILAIVGRLFGITMMGVAPGSLLRGASALYLLALVIMVYGKWYYCTEATPPPPKP